MGGVDEIQYTLIYVNMFYSRTSKKIQPVQFNRFLDMLDHISAQFVHPILVYVLLIGSLVPSHAKLVFKTASNETASVASVDGLIWTDVTPVEMLPVIQATADREVFDFCDINRFVVPSRTLVEIGCVLVFDRQNRE